MLALQQIDPLSFPSCIVSYGGPQSNSMLALAAVVQYQNTLIENMQSTPGHLRKLFVYYTKTLPRFLRNQPSGNLFRAQALGMELVEVSSDVYHSLFGNAESGVVGTTPPPTLEPLVLGDSVWIPQGGACAMALTGARVLAREILDFWIGQSSTTTLGSNGATTSSQPLSVCIPGGTCSTAALVHVALKEMQADTPPHVKKLDIEVVVIPCVGDEAYARRQMMNLQLHVFGPETTQKYGIPTILQPHPKKSILQSTIVPATELDYFRFGEPDPLILNTFREFRNDYDIVLDLLYGSPAWTIMLRHWTSYSTIDCGSVESKRETFDPDAPLDGRRIMYVHSGGLEGINSQLLRYKYKNLVDSDEIQLPGRRSNVVKNPSD